MGPAEQGALSECAGHMPKRQWQECSGGADFLPPGETLWDAVTAWLGGQAMTKWVETHLLLPVPRPRYQEGSPQGQQDPQR